ncbi:DUF4843 domain-containing protein [Sphingobacterium multivorum]|uniref:DUF4843 domain-containing protein n=1 Tax=Sphingobacterium multivorum TaxID=28454 RepID=UPI0031BB329C
MMKRLLTFIGACAALLFTLLGCKEDNKLMFDDSDPKVYIDKRYAGTRVDSVNYSFAFQSKDILTDTVQIPLRIIGLPRNIDRPVAIALTAGSTAKEGYHFKLEHAVIPANASDGLVDVIFFRRAGLKDSVVTAELKIIANADFKPGYNDKAVSAVLDRLTWRFTLTDKLEKPSIWDSYWKNLFGDYSNTKILFLTQLLDYTNWNQGGLFPQDSNRMLAQARLGIYEYEKANGPMFDENGNRVIIP